MPMCTASACMHCGPRPPPTPWRTTRTLPRCRSDWGMPTLPPRGCMIAGRDGRRRVRPLRWSIERAQEERGSLRVQSGEVRELLCELLNGLWKNKNPQGVSLYGIQDPWRESLNKTYVFLIPPAYQKTPHACKGLRGCFGRVFLKACERH